MGTHFASIFAKFRGGGDNCPSSSKFRRPCELIAMQESQGESEGKQDIGIKSKGFIGSSRVDFKLL